MRPTTLLLAAALSVALASVSAAAQPAKGPAKSKARTTMPATRPAPGEAALRTEAFERVSMPLAVEIRLLDDSPDNVELASRLRAELQAQGHLARGGSHAVMTIETDTGLILPGEPGAEPKPGQRPAFLGFVRATLDDPGSGVRLWEGEAVYRTGDGDLPRGAKAVLPHLVRALGQTVDDQAIRID